MFSNINMYSYRVCECDGYAEGGAYEPTQPCRLQDKFVGLELSFTFMWALGAKLMSPKCVKLAFITSWPNLPTPVFLFSAFNYKYDNYDYNYSYKYPVKFKGII